MFRCEGHRQEAEEVTDVLGLEDNRDCHFRGIPGDSLSDPGV